MGFLAKYLTDYNSDKLTFAKKMRINRIKLFLKMIETVSKNKGACSILDIGGTTQYWKILEDNYLRKFNVSITLFNLPGTKILKDTKFIKHISGDATNFIWKKINQNKFDLIHSNSVIEHVGDLDKMRKFAFNITSFKGGYFVQTPNYWFPIEPHSMTLFFHWLPITVRIFLVKKFQLGHWKKARSSFKAAEIVNSARLLDKAQFSKMFYDAEIISEKFFLLTKSYVAIRYSSQKRV